LVRESSSLIPQRKSDFGGNVDTKEKGATAAGEGTTGAEVMKGAVVIGAVVVTGLEVIVGAEAIGPKVTGAIVSGEAVNGKEAIDSRGAVGEPACRTLI